MSNKTKPGVPAKEFGVRMKLGVKDRLMIAQLLPREGNLITQRLIRDIGQKTELSQEEMDAVKMKSLPTGGVQWDDKLEKFLGQKIIKFTDSEIGFLKDQVKKLDEQKKITRDTFLLCERIHNLVITAGKEREDAPS